MSTLEPGTSHNSILQTQPAERLRILLEITNSLTGTLELDPLLPKILDSLFLIFRQADRGFVIVRDDAGKAIPKAIHTRREKDESSARFSRKVINQCMDTGQAFLSEDAMADDRFSLSQSISDFRIRSVICAPLRVGDGKVLGVLLLDTQDRAKKFTQEDLQLLVAVSNQAAVAMENARLHQESLDRQRYVQEMAMAEQVQKIMLPAKMPKLPPYEFYGFYRAAQMVGGDFYTFVELSGGRIAIALADVAGKGMPAALLMAKLSADVRTAVVSEADPVAAMCKLNELLQGAGMLDRFVTFVLAVLDTKTHKVTLTNAGHLCPVLRHAGDGQTEELTEGDLKGPPLGVIDGFPYQSCQVDMKPGDSIVLYTDGILDATSRSEEQFGRDRVLRALKSGSSEPIALAKQLLQQAEQFSTGHHQHDDITLVSFGRIA
jgi:serine phosphatase RsbU (regulator of sigma subunit)